MKAAIENLWNGNLVPGEKCGAGDPYLEELVELMGRNQETLRQKLDPLQIEVFDKYIDCTEAYIQLISMFAFQEGFCLASRLAAESFAD